MPAKHDFERCLKLGKPLPFKAFADLGAAKAYLVPGLKKVKKIIVSKAEKMDRNTHLFNWLENHMMERCSDLSFTTASNVKSVGNLIRDLRPGDPEAKAQAETLAARFKTTELSATTSLTLVRTIVLFHIILRFVFFTLLFYLFFVMPASFPAVPSRHDEFKAQVVRALPFLLAVVWGILGEFITPWQTSFRESETALLRIKRASVVVNQVLSGIAPYLEPNTALDSLV